MMTTKTMIIEMTMMIIMVMMIIEIFKKQLKHHLFLKTLCEE